MSTPLLEVTGLEASYGRTKVLHGIDFSLQRGGITTILGANGAGKTTTLRAISGLVKTRGRVTLEGRAVEGCKTEQITLLGVAHVPDGRGTFTDLTVDENLRLGAYSRRDRAEVARDFELVYSYFPQLAERRTQQAGTLSGGEQQMLAIARALLLNPSLLILDEPSEGLAPIIVQEIFQILQSLKSEGLSILLVEQNMRAAFALADRHHVLSKGQVCFVGTTAELDGNEAVKRQYLGV